MEFLNIVQAIASEVNASNVEKFISLVEGLISLGKSVEQHIQSESNSSSPQ
ncbi:MAG TPA: hypothetical protein VFF04_03100 [Candidatus Babeliales bacterium]|nr:hypothetical protein [Candidatus Babeliales bacterium]